MSKVKGFPYGGNGGSAALAADAWDISVTTQAELAAAVATAGRRILVTEDFAITSAIAFATGTHVLGRKPGKKITRTGFGNAFSAAAAVNITFVDPEVDKDIVTPFFVSNGSTWLNNTANWTVFGRASIATSVSGSSLCGSINNASMEKLVIQASAPYSMDGHQNTFGDVRFIGTNVEAYLQASALFKSLEMSGTFRADNAASTMATDYSVQLYSAGYPVHPQYGPILFKGVAQTPAVIAINCSVASVTATSAFYIPRVAISGFGSVKGGEFVPVFVDNTNAHAFKDCMLLAPARWETNSDSHDLYNCDLSGNWTFPTGSRPVFHGGKFSGNVVFASGSQPTIIGTQVGTVGTLNLQSGADATIIGLRSLTGATLTNSDPGLSRITLSESATFDTTPDTRRFANTTLDSELLPGLLGYWSLKSLRLLNFAPTTRQVAGPLYTNNKAIALSGGKINFGVNTDNLRTALPLFLQSREFTVSFWLTPVTASPGAEQNLFGAHPSSALGLSLIPGSYLRAYHNATASYATTVASGLLSDGIESQITWTRRDNAGTLTDYLYVDNVEVGAFALADNIGLTSYLTLGAEGVFNCIGTYRDFYLADVGISATAVSALHATNLKGAGIS